MSAKGVRYAEEAVATGTLETPEDAIIIICMNAMIVKSG